MITIRTFAFGLQARCKPVAWATVCPVGVIDNYGCYLNFTSSDCVDSMR